MFCSHAGAQAALGTPQSPLWSTRIAVGCSGNHSSYTTKTLPCNPACIFVCDASCYSCIVFHNHPASLAHYFPRTFACIRPYPVAIVLFHGTQGVREGPFTAQHLQQAMGASDASTALAGHDTPKTQTPLPADTLVTHSDIRFLAPAWLVVAHYTAAFPDQMGGSGLPDMTR